MNYLIYIEYAAENLQFFLWHRDYVKRFSELPPNERALAPEWTAEQAEAEALANQTTTTPTQKLISRQAAAVFKGTSFAPPSMVEPPTASMVELRTRDPFNTPPRTPTAEGRDNYNPSEYGWDDNDSVMRSPAKSFQQKTASAFAEADLKWQPCKFRSMGRVGCYWWLIALQVTIQPFREEISRVIATYVADGSPRQLNLSSKERASLLHALSATTHPSAIAKVIHTVEWSLRQQSHRNFIRWTICNGNRPRVIFARGLGVAGIVGGILAAILVVLSHAGRGWRVLSAIGFMIGIATLIAAWKGMCVVSRGHLHSSCLAHVSKVLHGMHHRHLRPWELFAEDDDSSSKIELNKASLDSGGSNAYEDEPWVAKYEKRNLIRKVFDREVWIQEPALRQIQDTIFLQALGGALLITAVCVAIFVAVPKGNYY